MASIAAVAIMGIMALAEFVAQFNLMTSPIQKLVAIAGFAVISYLVYVIPIRVLVSYIRR